MKTVLKSLNNSKNPANQCKFIAFLLNTISKFSYLMCAGQAFGSVTFYLADPDHLDGRRGIQPKTGLNPFLKSALNVFCMHKTEFFLEFFFLYLI